MKVTNSLFKELLPMSNSLGGKFNIYLIPSDEVLIAMCDYFNIDFDSLKLLESFQYIVYNHMGTLLKNNKYETMKGIIFPNLLDEIRGNIIETKTLPSKNFKKVQIYVIRQVLMNVEQRSLLEVQILLNKPLRYISQRSIIAIKRLKQDLIDLSDLTNVSKDDLSSILRIVRTVDNGDCFYDAFAQGYNSMFNRNGDDNNDQIQTIKSLRQIISDFAHDSGNEKQLINFKRILGKTYNEWYNYVHEDYETARKNNRNPIWGKLEVDGKILATYFNVNIRILSETFLYESNMEAEDQGFIDLNDQENRVIGDTMVRSEVNINNKITNKTILIGNIPGHFFAILE